MKTDMSSPINIDKVMERLQGSGRFRPVVRRVYDRYAEGEYGQLLVAIGRMVTPEFVLDADNRRVYVNLLRWANGVSFECQDPVSGEWIPGDPGKGLYLAGPTGTGKSVAMDALREYVRAIGATVRVDGQDVQLTWTSYRADELCDQFARTGDLSAYKRMPVLCIQDVGSEPPETLYMGNRVRVVRNILEYRGDYQNKLTLLTSNYGVQRIGAEQLYGPRVRSRLIGKCNYFELAGKDRRIKNKTI